MATDRSFVDSFETSGEWFIPNNPVRRIAGTLSYSPHGAELHLNEALRPLQGSIFAGDTERYPILHGITRDGEAMTLIDAHRMGVNINFGSAGLRQPERLYSTLLITGAHLPPDFDYPEISCRVPGLEVWLSRQIIHESLEKDQNTGCFVSHEFRVSISPEEITRVDEIGADLGWIVNSSSRADPFSSIVVTAAGWITIRPDMPKRLEWFFEQLEKLTALLSLLAGASMLADSMRASFGVVHRYASILVPQPRGKHWKPEATWHFFLTRATMEISLADLVARWFEGYPKFRLPSQLALDVMLSDNLWQHVEFLSLMQALEGLHRALYPGEYMSKAGYTEIENELRNAIPASVLLDHRDALRSRIRYGYQYSLTKRLSELAARLAGPIRALIFGPEARAIVPRKWIDTRNYYTHWDEELLPKILDGQEMIYAHVRMRHFLRALYLDLAGVPQSAIHKALTNASSDSQYLIQINGMEQRRADPTSTSGLVMVVKKGNEEPNAQKQGAAKSSPPESENKETTNEIPGS